MQEPSPELKALYEKALQYEAARDHYNAVKLYKRIVKEARYWAPPLARLGEVYKYRQEWKPALYYHKKAVSLDVGNQTAWWNIGIAATALKRGRLARNVWAKFGFSTDEPNLSPVSVRFYSQGQFEILWVSRLGPARGFVRNIPHPGSGRRYGDIVLIDNVVQGHHTSDSYRLPVYEELGLLKISHYRTFSCVLQSASPQDIKILQQLCRDENLGFEVWANASYAFASSYFGDTPEYYFHTFEPQSELLVAVAAPRHEAAREVLDSWKVISLKTYTDFKAHQV